VNSKAECVQLNPAHVARKYKKKKLKQTNAIVHLNQARSHKQQESPLSLTTGAGAMVLQISRGDYLKTASFYV